MSNNSESQQIENELVDVPFLDEDYTPNIDEWGLETTNPIDSQSFPKEIPIRKFSLLLTIIYIIFYTVADLILPLYNKLLFQGFGREDGFHYPVTATMFQVAAVAVFLLIYCCIYHFYKVKVKKMNDDHWVFNDWKIFWKKVYVIHYNIF